MPQDRESATAGVARKIAPTVIPAKAGIHNVRCSKEMGPAVITTGLGIRDGRVSRKEANTVIPAKAGIHTVRCSKEMGPAVITTGLGIRDGRVSRKEANTVIPAKAGIHNVQYRSTSARKVAAALIPAPAAMTVTATFRATRPPRIPNPVAMMEGPISLLYRTLWIPAFAGMTVGAQLSGLLGRHGFLISRQWRWGRHSLLPRTVWIPAFAGMTVGVPFVATPDGMDSRFRGNDGGGGFSGLPGRYGFPLSRE